MSARKWEIRFGIGNALNEDGMDQRELAKRLGWSESRLSRKMSGKARLYAEDILELSRAQGRDLYWYFYGYALSTLQEGIDLERVKGLSLSSMVLTAA